MSVRIGTNRRVGEILQSKVGIAGKSGGHSANDVRGGINFAFLGLGKNKIEDTLGFGIEATGEIKPSKIDMRRHALLAGRLGRRSQKAVTHRQEI